VTSDAEQEFFPNEESFPLNRTSTGLLDTDGHDTVSHGRVEERSPSGRLFAASDSVWAAARTLLNVGRGPSQSVTPRSDLPSGFLQRSDAEAIAGAIPSPPSQDKYDQLHRMGSLETSTLQRAVVLLHSYMETILPNAVFSLDTIPLRFEMGKNDATPSLGYGADVDALDNPQECNKAPFNRESPATSYLVLTSPSASEPSSLNCPSSVHWSLPPLCSSPPTEGTLFSSNMHFQAELSDLLRQLIDRDENDDASDRYDLYDQ
jgi:hypothetical protein